MQNQKGDSFSNISNTNFGILIFSPDIRPIPKQKILV